MTTNKDRTKETLFNVKRRTYQRMEICIQIDVPDDAFDRDSVNQAALSLVGTIERPNPETMWPEGCRVVLVTSQEA